MTVRFDDALASLHEMTGSAPDDVRRTDVRPDGSLVLEAAVGRGQRWYRYGPHGLESLRPWDDERVPLAARVRECSDDRVRLLAWRPGRRLTIQLRTSRGTSIVKGLRPRRWERIASNLEGVSRAHSGAPDSFVTPRVRRCIPHLAAVQASWIDAPQLRIAHDTVGSWQAAGRALRTMQKSVGTHGLPRHDALAELGVLDSLAERVGPILGSLPAGWQEVRDEVAARLPLDGPLVAAHRDLHDRQLLASGDRVGLIDFDLLSSAHPALDYANLTVHLQLRALQHADGADESTAEACGRAVLEGCAECEGSEFVAALRCFQAAAFLRLALIYALRPRWKEAASKLLPFSRRCLDDVPAC